MNVQKWHDMNQTQLEEDYLSGKRKFVKVPGSRLEQFFERSQKHSAREQATEIEESNDEHK